jgi:hypothetical protein
MIERSARLILAALVVLPAGIVALASTYGLLRSALPSPHNLAAFEGRLRHFTDRLVTTSDGDWRWIPHPHPIRVTMAVWFIAAAVFVWSLFEIGRGRRRPRLAA